MNRWKLHISPWYSLGLTVFLVILCMVVAIGTTWARYRAEGVSDIRFQASPPGVFFLGTVEYPDTPEVPDPDAPVEIFVPGNVGVWERNASGDLRLRFAVANGTSREDAFEERDQRFSVRLIGSLGFLNGEVPVSLKLILPRTAEPEDAEAPEKDAEAIEQVEATAIRIAPDSPLYTTFGDGWMFCFLDAEGEEIAWTLEGGALTYRNMELSLESGGLVDMSLLQIQINGGYVQD